MNGEFWMAVIAGQVVAFWSGSGRVDFGGKHLKATPAYACHIVSHNSN